MNKIYRLVWNHIRACWVAAHERSRSHGKRATRSRGISLIAGGLAGILAAPLVIAAPPAPDALPQGGQVVAGQAAIRQAGTTLNVNQASSRAILNWQGFNIGSNATVQFNQPGADAVALNRVIGPDPSAIYGTLSANGQVFLVNSNGVLFGPGSQVDVSGLVASTLNIRDNDFLTGHYHFTRDGTTSAVINQGTLSGNYVALLAPTVRNDGVVTAAMGTVAFAAGEAVTLGITGNRLIDVQADKATVDTLVENGKMVRVDGGRAVLTAQSVETLLGRVVNSGAVAADGISSDGGTIRLTASSQVQVDGSLSARGGTAGNGGMIETSADRVSVADTATIDTSAANGSTGQWLIDPYDFTVGLTSTSDITGAALSTALATNDVTIQTTDTGASCSGATCGVGSSSGNGDIFINDSVSWSATHTLTLNAWRNIEVNAPITVSGSGGVALVYGQDGLVADFSAMGAVYVRAPINLTSASSFTSKFGSDGTTDTYTVITTEAALKGLTTNDSTVRYALGANISVTTNPWVPIGNSAATFDGVFDGLGHTVDGVTRPNTDNGSYIGLFGYIGLTGLVQNLGVTNVNVAGGSIVGGLAGQNDGTVVNSYATGMVTGSDAAGVGANTGTNDDSVLAIGGLVGANNGMISNSYSTATVTATTGLQTLGSSFDGGTGGLVGMNLAGGGGIDSSYATGSVSGILDVGGLVGYSESVIGYSYAIGSVSGTSSVGGLVGALAGFGTPGLLQDTFWDKTTSGQTTSATDGVNSSTGLATSAAMTQSSYTNWDFTNTWVIRAGSSYPLLRAFLPPLFIKADDQSKTYDGSVYSGGYSATFSSGLTASDPLLDGTAVAYSGTSQTATAAGSYTITPSGPALADQTDQQGYLSVTFVNGTLTINPATVTINGSLTGTVSKTYDGTNTATLTSSNFVLTGWSGSDGATVTKTSGTFDNANTGTGKLVTVSLTSGDFSPTGSTNLSNYTLPTSISGNVGEITQKTVSLSASKTYDGNTDLTGAVTITTGIAGEALTYTGATANSKNVGAGNFINAITLADGTGGLAANYQLPTLDATNAPVTINTKAVTLSATKTYDGSTDLTGAVTLSGLVGSETLTYTGATANSKDVKDNGSNYINAITLQDATDSSGGLANNYQLPTLNVTNAPVTINRATVTINLPASYTITKTYDGTDAATLNLVGSLVDSSGKPIKGVLSGIAPGELYLPKFNLVTTGTSIAVNIYGNYQATAGFNAKDATTNKPVTFTTPTWINALDTNTTAGTDNYIFPSSISSTAGEITPKPIQVALNNGVQLTKVYDGNTQASLNDFIYKAVNFDFTTWGFVSGEQAGAQTITVNYSDKNAGTKDLNVTYADWVPGTGTKLSNYTLPSAQTYTNAGIISPLGITVTGQQATNRNYDATTNVELTGGTLNGVISGDDIKAGTGTGSISKSDVGNNLPVTVTATELTGTDKNNYTLTQFSSGVTVNITPAPLNLAIGDVQRVYDGTKVVQLTGTLSGILQSDNGQVSLVSGTGLLSAKDVGEYTGISGDPTLLPSLSGAAAHNYDIAGYTGLDTFKTTVSAKQLDVKGLTANKVYDGTTAVALSGTPEILAPVAIGAGSTSDGQPYAGDDITVTLGTATGTFSAATVGTSDVTVSGEFSVGGKDAGNYVPVALPFTGTITPAPLTITANDQQKTEGTVLTFKGNEYSVDGTLFGQDRVNSVTLQSEGATASAYMPSYPITASDPQGTGLGNYDITFLDGTLTLKPATLKDVVSALFAGLDQAGMFDTGSVSTDEIGLVDSASYSSASASEAVKQKINSNNILKALVNRQNFITAANYYLDEATSFNLDGDTTYDFGTSNDIVKSVNDTVDELKGKGDQSGGLWGKVGSDYELGTPTRQALFSAAVTLQQACPACNTNIITMWFMRGLKTGTDNSNLGD